MKQILLTLIVILLVSCQQKQEKKVFDSKKDSRVETEKEIINSASENSTIENYIKNDSLQNHLYDNLEKLTTNPVFKISKKPINNRHVDNLVDTIITQKYKENEIKSYMGASEVSIYKANFNTPEFKFLDSITVGIKKEKFDSILKINLESDHIIIGNFEETSEFIFSFKDGILINIRFDGYLD